MRLYLTICLFAFLSISGLAQSTGRRAKSTLYSASSEWQKVTLKPTASLATSLPVNTPTTSASQSTNRADPATSSTRSIPSENVDYRPAFTGDFATNRNGWKAGNQGDYYYQIGLGRYSVRKRDPDTKQIAFSTVDLPTAINLNSATIFTIKVDVLADSGQVPTGGLLFGVKDSLNYSAFTLNSKGEVSIIRIANGQTFSDYMTGEFYMPGVTVDKNRNRLSIQRKGEALHFYVNDREIRSSPYPFKILSGNGIGITASGYWTSFQKLIVTLGP